MPRVQILLAKCMMRLNALGLQWRQNKCDCCVELMGNPDGYMYHIEVSGFMRNVWAKAHAATLGGKGNGKQ